MKKEDKLDKILNSIAVEKAPERLIHKWKVEVELQKGKKRVYTLLLRPSIFLPLLFASFWYYFAVFKKELFENYLSTKITPLFRETGPVVADATSNILSTDYYIIGMTVFSILFSAAFLFWFYKGNKLRYTRIKNF